MNTLKKYILLFAILLIPILFLLPISIKASVFLFNHQRYFYDNKPPILMVMSFFYFSSYMAVFLSGYCLRRNNQISLPWLLKIINTTGFMTAMVFCITTGLIIFLSKVMANRNGLDFTQLTYLIRHGLFYHSYDLGAFIFLIFITAIFRKVIKKGQFDIHDAKQDKTGYFGTAAWATIKDFETLNFYNANNGILSGADEKGGYLYLPLLNKLTISPPGGGKTSASSIPLLLSYNGPVFVFDIKGELWATSARYRSEVLKRKVITIDPYKVTQQEAFIKGKPEELVKEYTLNPFDWIPDDKGERDRMINAFASSFIINEGGTATHFDENAKILIRGFIDYIMQTVPKESRTLETLYHLLSEQSEQAKFTFEQMSQLSGRASAASNQIGRVGSDERGSILSTSYRQIDWIGDSNIQHTLSESNFDLREFLQGNMDIFIVLPEDQVKENSRLFRMIMSLLMSMLVQADPSELPAKKIVMLLEEVAQLGYSPDIELAIEVLRARQVVVWTVFQTLKQIELFEKPDLFKGAPIKQIFTNDDTETMQWIQTLGGKKTIITKTISVNSGDSRQATQFLGGTVSKGESESIQETGTDLIPLNEIREMPYHQQIVFLHGVKPIFCKKVRYFECKEFLGKFDQNPLEIH